MRVISPRKQWQAGLLTAAVLILVVALFLGSDIWFLRLTAEDIKSYAEQAGPWSVAASIGLMVLHSFVPLPAEVIAVANGMMFGLFGGVVVTWIGAMLGAALSFAIARQFGRPALRWLVSERRWHAIDRWELQPASLLVVRLIPVISFNLINYAAGVANVGWFTFLWTTAIGILPLTVVSVLLGDTILQTNWVIAGLIVCGLAIFWFAMKHWRLQQSVNELFMRPSNPPDKNINLGG